MELAGVQEREGWLRGGRAWLLLLLLALFTAMGLYQAWPQFGQPLNFDPGDDWTVYHQRALDVLQHGLAMSAVQEPYSAPAGFLYIYFVALCYALLGAHPARVFVVQSAMLGLTVWLLFTAFAPGRRRLTQLLLLAALVCFALVDVQRHYVMRLLSENLMLPILALFFRLLFAGLWRGPAKGPGRSWGPALALRVLGALPLARPNAMIFIPPLAAWLLLSRQGRELIAPRRLVLGLALFALVFSAMGIRNHAVTGRWIMFTPARWEMFEAPGYGKGLMEALNPAGPAAPREGVLPMLGLIAKALADHPLATSEAYARRLLYCLGFMPLLEPSHHYRPHWMLAWALYLAGLACWLGGRAELDARQAVLALWVWPMLAVVAGVSWVASYGFRFQVPIVLPMLGGAAWALDALRGLPDRRCNR